MRSPYTDWRQRERWLATRQRDVLDCQRSSKRRHNYQPTLSHCRVFMADHSVPQPNAAYIDSSCDNRCFSRGIVRPVQQRVLLIHSSSAKRQIRSNVIRARRTEKHDCLRAQRVIYRSHDVRLNGQRRDQQERVHPHQNTSTCV